MSELVNSNEVTCLRSDDHECLVLRSRTEITCCLSMRMLDAIWLIDMIRSSCRCRTSADCFICGNENNCKSRIVLITSNNRIVNVDAHQLVNRTHCTANVFAWQRRNLFVHLTRTFGKGYRQCLERRSLVNTHIEWSNESVWHETKNIRSRTRTRCRSMTHHWMTCHTVEYRRWLLCSNIDRVLHIYKWSSVRQRTHTNPDNRVMSQMSMSDEQWAMSDTLSQLK
jgi:hypothetical protein